MSRAEKHLTIIDRFIRAVGTRYPRHRIPADVRASFQESLDDTDRGNR